VDEAGDMIIWPALPFTNGVLVSEITKLQQCLVQPNLSNRQVKTALGQAVATMMQATFDQVPVDLLRNVLTMGLNPSDQLPAEVVTARHAEIVTALTKAIGNQEQPVPIEVSLAPVS
jgi:hypothetical protein